MDASNICTCERLWALKIAPKGTNDWKFYIPNWIYPWPVQMNIKGAKHSLKEIRSYFRACKIKGYRFKIVELEVGKK